MNRNYRNAMKTSDIIKYFGTQVEAANQLGVTQPTISNWKRRGVPPLQQLRIQHFTAGRLQADTKIFAKRKQRT